MTADRDLEGLLPLSNLSFQVLLALGSGPSHGYAIIRDIEERTDGRVSVRSGTLYTMIQRLQEDGLLEYAAPPRDPGLDGRRKYYRITPLGRRAARAEAERLADLLDVARARKLAPERP
jgi:DNA-binding PadR family transcriptional regulator